MGSHWVDSTSRTPVTFLCRFLPLFIPMLCLLSEELNADDVMDIELDFPDLSDSALPTGGALPTHYHSQEVSFISLALFFF